MGGELFETLFKNAFTLCSSLDSLGLKFYADMILYYTFKCILPLFLSTKFTVEKSKSI